MNIAHYLEQQGMKKGRLEGLMEGMRKGLVEGLLEGMVKGRLEGKKEGRRQATHSITLHLLASGVDLGLIKTSTGLSDKELENLRAEYYLKLI